MPSFVWERDIAEAYQEPYEYGGQEQFSREAKRVVNLLKKHYSQFNQKFGRDEKTLEKAIWMLQVDGLEALSDALILTDERRHRIASRMFRDAVESLDTSAYFYLSGESRSADLYKWYENKVIPHRRFRELVKQLHGEAKAKDLSSLYSDLSKYTHRTYKAINMSYILGRNNVLIYDGFKEPNMLVLPHVISFSYALIGTLIKRFVRIAETTEQITSEEVKRIWKESLEEETVPRRFGIGPGQFMRGPPMEILLDDDS